MAAARLLNACEAGDLDTIRRLLSAPLDDADADGNEEGGLPAQTTGSGAAAAAATGATGATTSAGSGEDEEEDSEGPDPNGDYNPEEDDEDEDDEDFFDPEEGKFANMGFERATTESRDRWRITPLGAAIMGHQLDAVDLLISLDANANGNIEGSYLLHYTCAIGGVSGNTEAQEFAHACIQKLIAAGAKSETVDEFLRTPLHIAAGAGLVSCVETLMESVDSNVLHQYVDAQDNRGQSALHVAARFGRNACVKALVDAGASLFLRDHRGRTAAHHAAEVGNESGLNLCIKKAADGTLPVDGMGQTARSVLDQFMDIGGAKPPTLICYPHQSVDHKTAISIARGEDDPPPENEQRVHVLVNSKFGTLRASEFNGLVEWDEDTPRAKMSDILRVHDHLYVNMVKTRCEACAPSIAGASAEAASGTAVAPSVQNFLPGELRPSKANQLTQLDMDTVMSHESYEAAMYAAGAACHAVDKVMSGEFRNAFCVVRPPGHHAGPRGVVTCPEDPDGGSHGFCLFNNVAIGAAYARHMYRHAGIKKVAILDFDVHHGNGTEALVRNLVPSTVTSSFPTLFGEITLESPSFKPWLDEQDSENVFFVSLHGYGNGFYPSSGRTSSDRPVFNVGWPLHKDKDRASSDWRKAWRGAVMPALMDFDPDMIFLSCGVDGHRKDEMNHGFVALQVGPE